jgi:DNA-binding XRE family transcriptional regulator
MSAHICRQCTHYTPNDKPRSPNGKCVLLGCPVWSRRPECASKTGDMFKPLDTLGNRLRTARVAAVLSRDEVCAETGVTMKSLKNWETDTYPPPDYAQKMLLEFYKKKTP